MDPISQVTASNTQNQAQSQSSAAQLNSDFDTFLQLLTTQMQHQDPLDPVESQEFTNQLVAFSGVEQQIRTNQQLENLVTMQVLGMTSLGLGFIGLDVEISGEFAEYDGENPMEFGYTMPEAATENTITIKDSDGNVVYTADGELGTGKHKFTWNGLDDLGQPVEAGTYQVEVTAFNGEEEALAVPTTVQGHVDGIESGEYGEIMLLIGDRKVSVTDVRRAIETGS